MDELTTHNINNDADFNHTFFSISAHAVDSQVFEDQLYVIKSNQRPIISNQKIQSQPYLLSRESSDSSINIFFSTNIKISIFNFKFTNRLSQFSSKQNYSPQKEFKLENWILQQLDQKQ